MCAEVAKCNNCGKPLGERFWYNRASGLRYVFCSKDCYNNFYGIDSNDERDLWGEDNG